MKEYTAPQVTVIDNWEELNIAPATLEWEVDKEKNQIVVTSRYEQVAPEDDDDEYRHFKLREEALEVLRVDCDPAEIEIESIACLEAIACGRVPLIADSPRSATRYFALTERNLFRYNDPADLAEKMDWWLEHPEERERCSAEYLGFSSQFDFDRCMDAMEQMLLDAAEEKRHAG